MTIARVELRKATASEVPELRHIVTEAYSRYVPLVAGTPAPMVADYDALVRDENVWVAVGDGRIQGLVVLVPGPDQMLLENVAVRPSSQGHGTGRILMNLAETETRRLGLTAVTLYTNEVMVENLAWYLRLGYQETERREEHGFRRIYLRKTL